MKLTEMVKLAGAGYKPAEIRELAEIAKENPEALQLAEKLKFDEVKDLISLASEADADPDPKPKEPAKEDPDTDERDQAADRMQKENEELKVKLKEAQEANTRKEIVHEESDPQETLNEFCRMFI